MRPLRFRECMLDGNMRTVLETAIPLTPFQRMAARNYALNSYRKRIVQARGWKRDGMMRIITELEHDTFLERPVPKSDSERECIIFGS